MTTAPTAPELAAPAYRPVHRGATFGLYVLWHARTEAAPEGISVCVARDELEARDWLLGQEPHLEPDRITRVALEQSGYQIIRLPMKEYRDV